MRERDSSIHYLGMPLPTSSIRQAFVSDGFTVDWCTGNRRLLQNRERGEDELETRLSASSTDWSRV